MSKSNANQLGKLVTEIIDHLESLDQDQLNLIVRKYPKDSGGHYSKSLIISFYRQHIASDPPTQQDRLFINRVRMKPVRSISGVTPITVLTKPFPCPGKCIFCPNDVRMPKSYIASEPGAQRAEKNHFDPYLQTFNRLSALHDIGHNVDKAEIIVLGGTWSIYPEEYQIWFVKRCFEALNDFGSSKDQRGDINPSIDVSQIKSDKRDSGKSYNQTVSHLYQDQETIKKSTSPESATWDELFSEHAKNEQGKIRCVGLVLETRPDNISQKEVLNLRKLGCTKTQIGLQSLQDSVLAKNNRGHDVAASRRALKLLRLAGLKIHIHWMPNLYGSSVAQDIADYHKLFSDPDFRPDEIKIYPCSLIDDTELVEVFNRGDWQPYNRQELLKVLVSCLTSTPEYCRITRVVRDIPSDEIVTGNKITNFRQLAELEAQNSKLVLSDIRSREIKNQTVTLSQIDLKTLCYQTSSSIEYFLQYVTKKDNKIAGFLRLSLPTKKSFISEISDSAIIREVHVYGQAIQIGDKKSGKTQHLGLGKELIKAAESIAKQNNYQSISVISAIGTRQYYSKLGYQRKDLYQTKNILS